MTIQSVDLFIVSPKDSDEIYTNTSSLTKQEAKMKMLCFLSYANVPPLPLHFSIDQGIPIDEMWSWVEDSLQIKTMTVRTVDTSKIKLGRMVLDMSKSDEAEYPEAINLGQNFNVNVFHLLAQERADYLWEPFGRFRFKERKHAARAKLVYG